MSTLTVTGRIPDWTLTDRLRKAREDAGMRQLDLSEQLGIARATIANYERAVTVPGRPVLVSWALVTGVDLAWLEHGDDGGLPHLDSNQEPAGYRSAQVITLRPAA